MSNSISTEHSHETGNIQIEQPLHIVSKPLTIRNWFDLEMIGKSIKPITNRVLHYAISLLQKNPDSPIVMIVYTEFYRNVMNKRHLSQRDYDEIRSAVTELSDAETMISEIDPETGEWSQTKVKWTISSVNMGSYGIIHFTPPVHMELIGRKDYSYPVFCLAKLSTKNEHYLYDYLQRQLKNQKEMDIQLTYPELLTVLDCLGLKESNKNASYINKYIVQRSVNSINASDVDLSVSIRGKMRDGRKDVGIIFHVWKRNDKVYLDDTQYTAPHLAQYGLTDRNGGPQLCNSYDETYYSNKIRYQIEYDVILKEMEQELIPPMPLQLDQIVKAIVSVFMTDDTKPFRLNHQPISAGELKANYNRLNKDCICAVLLDFLTREKITPNFILLALYQAPIQDERKKLQQQKAAEEENRSDRVRKQIDEQISYPALLFDFREDPIKLSFLNLIEQVMLDVYTHDPAGRIKLGITHMPASKVQGVFREITKFHVESVVTKLLNYSKGEIKNPYEFVKTYLWNEPRVMDIQNESKVIADMTSHTEGPTSSQGIFDGDSIAAFMSEDVI